MKTLSLSTTLFCLVLAALLSAGCAAKSAKVENAEPATEPTSAPEEESMEADNANKIQGINGFKGEIHGAPATNSKFYALQIGMTVKQVTDILGRPSWRGTYGKPFDFSGDRTAFQLRYRKQGNLIFTGGKLFNSAPGNLIIINHDDKELAYGIW